MSVIKVTNILEVKSFECFAFFGTVSFYVLYFYQFFFFFVHFFYSFRSCREYCILLSTTRPLIFCNVTLSRCWLCYTDRCRIGNNSKNIFMEITRSIYFLLKRKGILKLFFSIVFLTISLSLLRGRRRFQK